MRIVPGHLPEWVDTVRTMFREYADEIRVDLCFQGFARELAGLPGDYVPPGGRLFLALEGEEPAGCVAIHACSAGGTCGSPSPGQACGPEPSLAPRVCEIKRLYVRPAYRGAGLGRRLAMVAIKAAREIGYEHMLLDTLPEMTTAIGLYRSLGFVDARPYRHNPMPGAVFLELDLTAAR